MSDAYHVRVRGRTLGPYALDAIRQMTRRGQVGRTHEISLDGAAWAPATSFPEIFERPVVSHGQAAAAVSSAVESPGMVPFGPEVMWHYTQAGAQQPLPVTQSQLASLIASGQVRADDQVWCETMTDWVMVSRVPDLAIYAMPAAGPVADGGLGDHGMQGGFPAVPTGRSVGGQSPVYRQFVAKKTAAGVLALFLGALGVHKFMLGLTTGGLTMLLLFFLIIPIPALGIIALAEAIIYLTKSDEQFFRDYAINRKQWF